MAGDPAPRIREVCAEILGRIKDRTATPALLDATRDRAAPVRLAAVIALGQARDPAAVPELLALVRGGGELSRSAIAAVESIGEPSAVAPLLQILPTAEQNNRVWIRHAVVALARPEHNEIILKTLSSPDVGLRATAAEASVKAPHSSYAPVLTQVLLQDPEAEIRRLAATSLMHYHDGAALKPLLAALTAEKEPSVRGALVRTLYDLALNSMAERKQLQEADAIDVLAPILANDPVAELRAGAADVLGKMQEPRGLDALAGALQSDRVAEVQIAAARALGELRDPAAIPALEAAAKNPNAEVKSEAMRALQLLRAAQRGIPSGRSRR
jgi:HEAT repeat protein